MEYIQSEFAGEPLAVGQPLFDGTLAPAKSDGVGTVLKNIFTTDNFRTAAETGLIYTALKMGGTNRPETGNPVVYLGSPNPGPNANELSKTYISTAEGNSSLLTQASGFLPTPQNIAVWLVVGFVAILLFRR
jgi:hypothetical protein